MALRSLQKRFERPLHDRVPRGRWLPTFTAYLGAQGTGFVVNWLIFGLCLGLLPSGRLSLVAAVVLAAIGGLAVDFFGARRLVFGAGFNRAVATAGEGHS